MKILQTIYQNKQVSIQLVSYKEENAVLKLVGSKQLADRELQILDRAKHIHNVTKPLSEVTSYNGQYGFVMKYYPYTLTGYMHNNRKNLRSVLKQLATCVAELHKAGIYHRDLKRENIMVTEDGTPVIIDFGSSTMNTHSRSRVGTMRIVPPEVRGDSEYNCERFDIWSFGCLIYELAYDMKFKSIYAGTRYDDLIKYILSVRPSLLYVASSL